MLRTPCAEARSPSRSTSTLTISARPAKLAASLSTTGAIALQGGHQVAEKSARTTPFWFSSSVNSLSVTSLIAVFAIRPPFESALEKPAAPVKTANDRVRPAHSTTDLRSSSVAMIMAVCGFGVSNDDHTGHDFLSNHDY